MIREAEKEKITIYPFLMFSEVCDAIRKKCLVEIDKAKSNSDEELFMKYEKLYQMSIKGDKRSIRRYLKNLIYKNKIIYDRNEYCSDILWDLKNMIEHALSSEYFKRVDKWELKIMQDLYQVLLSYKQEWKNAPLANMMNQLEDWMDEHVKIYLSTNKDLLDGYNLDLSIMNHVISLIDVITMKVDFKPLFLSDQPFTIIIDVKPTPFNFVDER